MTVPKKKECPKCRGTGRASDYSMYDKCKYCGGIGKIREMIKIIEQLQDDYARHCGHENFEELGERDEEALRVWYLKMLELIETPLPVSAT